MAEGRFRFGLTMLGSYMYAAHDVDDDQHEPGLADAEQPAHHELDIGLLEWQLDAQLGVSRRFAFELQMPVRASIVNASFSDAQGVDLPNVSSIHHRDETIAGIGDVLLSGRFALVLPQQVPRWTLTGRVGASLPTGRTRPDPFVLGAMGREHQHMFFGSGTLDPALGLDTNVMFDKWALVGWSFARVPLYENYFGYRASTVVVGGLGAQSSFGLRRWTFLVQPEVYFETPARWSGRPAPNSGRTSLIAGAGVFVRPNDRWLLHLLAKVPYKSWVQGGQLRWPFVLSLGFTYTFDIARKR